MRLKLATLALASAIAFAAQAPASAHPNVPGLSSKSPAAGKMVTRGAAGVLASARRYVGTKPKGMMRRLWCAQFIGYIERKHGRRGTGSNMARSYEGYGVGVTRKQARPGDIVTLKRGRNGRSGHVGYFVKWLPNGRVLLVSGNAGGGKVRESSYAVNRITAIRRPA